MHKNIFAILAADKAVALGVIEPLHCSLFHIVFYSCSFVIVTLEGFGRNLAQVLAVKARGCSRPIRSNAHKHRTR